MKVQRLRLTFSRGQEQKYLSHLDLMRLWVRALHRSGLPLAYSQGFTPRPRLSLAVPLAVGVTSQAELLDIFLARRVSPFYIMKGLSSQLPKGIDLLEVHEVALGLPSLQSLVRYAEYRVEIDSQEGPQELQRHLEEFLAREHFSWEHLRDGQARRYDLRPLVEDLWLEGGRDGVVILGMMLRADEAGSGRPEQVAAALGFPHPPHSIHRTRIALASPPSGKGLRAPGARPTPSGRRGPPA